VARRGGKGSRKHISTRGNWTTTCMRQRTPTPTNAQTESIARFTRGASDRNGSQAGRQRRILCVEGPGPVGWMDSKEGERNLLLPLPPHQCHHQPPIPAHPPHNPKITPQAKHARGAVFDRHHEATMRVAGCAHSRDAGVPEGGRAWEGSHTRTPWASWGGWGLAPAYAAAPRPPPSHGGGACAPACPPWPCHHQGRHRPGAPTRWMDPRP
jgi:hypothetical protein